MKQSRTMSLIEAVTNVTVGYGLAVITQMLVFPLFGLRTNLGDHLLIGVVFTIESIAKGQRAAQTTLSEQIGLSHLARSLSV